MSSSEFRRVVLPTVGKRVLRLGIAGNYGIDASDVRYAAERGANYWVFTGRTGELTKGLREVLPGQRDKHVVALLRTSLWGGQVRRGIENTLKTLRTDYIDIYKLGWLGRGSRYSSGILEVLHELKDEGKLRAIGASIHDRPRAGQLARDSALDMLMVRYSAKHPGAEQDIFPHLSVRQPGIVAYTATAWRQLLRSVAGVSMPPWPGDGAGNAASSSASTPPPLTAPLCYRFCLSSPHVHVVLTGPATRAQLEENLGALDSGPLSDEEMAWVRAYGKQIKSKRKLDYL